MAERQLLGDDAAAGEAGDVGGSDVERAQDRGGVVGHLLDRDRTFGHRGPSRAAVVERGQPVPVREPVELELPRLDGVAEAADEQHVRPQPDLVDVDLEAVRLDHRGRLSSGPSECSCSSLRFGLYLGGAEDALRVPLRPSPRRAAPRSSRTPRRSGPRPPRRGSSGRSRRSTTARIVVADRAAERSTALVVGRVLPKQERVDDEAGLAAGERRVLGAEPARPLRPRAR